MKLKLFLSRNACVMSGPNWHATPRLEGVKPGRGEGSDHSKSVINTANGKATQPRSTSLCCQEKDSGANWPVYVTSQQRLLRSAADTNDGCSHWNPGRQPSVRRRCSPSDPGSLFRSILRISSSVTFSSRDKPPWTTNALLFTTNASGNRRKACKRRPPTLD